MMSTALIATIGVERTDAGPSVSDRNEDKGISFADSFEGRVNVAVPQGEQGNRFNDGTAVRLLEANKDVAAEASGNKDEISAGEGIRKEAVSLMMPQAEPGSIVRDGSRSLNDIAAKSSLVPGPGQSKVAGERQIAAGEGLNGMPAKDMSSKDISGGGEVTKTANAKVNESPLQEEPVETKEGAVDTFPILKSNPSPENSRDAALLTQENEVTSKQDVSAKDDVTHLIQQKGAVSEKAHDRLSSKKLPGTQKDSAGLKSGLNVTAEMVTAGGAGSSAPVAMAAQEMNASVPVTGTVSNANRGDEIGGLVDGVSGGRQTSARPVVSSAANGSGKEFKVAEAGGRVDAKDSAENDSSSGTPIVLNGSTDEIARSEAIPAKDSDGKIQLIAAGQVHVASGSEGASTGVIAGLVGGHTSEGVQPKISTGESQAHAPGLENRLSGRDGVSADVPDTGETHRTLLATPTSLEIGVANGTQGWLKIRAEMTDPGVVNASLSSATAAGQEMLHRELPGLTAYLHDERIAVNTIGVHASVASDSGARHAGSLDGRADGQAQQRGRDDGGERRQATADGLLRPADDTMGWAALNGTNEESLSVGTYAGGGSWLNVRV